MDIQVLGKTSLKLKIKKTTLAVDPEVSIQKFDADAILLTGKEGEITRITNFRVVIDGAGEYEVSGLKIVGMKSDEGCMFALNSDNTDILITKASLLKNLSTEKVGDYKIVVVNADTDISESIITAMEPSAIILYGEKAKEAAKALGKENATSSSKISLSEDKLPEETDIMLLI